MLVFFFFKDTATSEFYPLSQHAPLPSYAELVAAGVGGVHALEGHAPAVAPRPRVAEGRLHRVAEPERSEEHTSELQSRQYLVCRLLLEKKYYFRNGKVDRIIGTR